jgi:hypothetical protein
VGLRTQNDRTKSRSVGDAAVEHRLPLLGELLELRLLVTELWVLAERPSIPGGIAAETPDGDGHTQAMPDNSFGS